MTDSGVQADVLGRLLIIQQTLDAFPDETRIAEFICRALKTVPGVSDVLICIRGRMIPPDVLFQAICAQSERAWDAPGSLDLAAVDRKNNAHYFPLRTAWHLFGLLIVLVADEDMVRPYLGLLGNTANTMGIILSTRMYQAKLAKSNEELRIARDESERLLLNLLPYPIAERLKARPDLSADSIPAVIADSFPEVTVLFADIVEFTRFSAGMSAERLVAVLNEIFTDFDSIADHRGLEKIKTIGDAYMAAAGLPVPAADHAVRVAHMALDMMDALDRFNARSGYRLQLRIGINSGAVVAGVIGTRKFIYDLWGDTVNTASRMESHGVAGRVQVTDATRRRLGEPFLFEERGIIDAKGIGELHTWFLTGRNGAPRPNDARPQH